MHSFVCQILKTFEEKSCCLIAGTVDALSFLLLSPLSFLSLSWNSTFSVLLANVLLGRPHAGALPLQRIRDKQTFCLSQPVGNLRSHLRSILLLTTLSCCDACCMRLLLFVQPALYELCCVIVQEASFSQKPIVKVTMRNLVLYSVCSAVRPPGWS